MKKTLAAIVAAATVAASLSASAALAINLTPAGNSDVTVAASTDSVTVTASQGYSEGAFAEWSAVSGASGYNVYADGTKIDSMLIRQYATCFRADAVGLKAGSHTLKIVPIIGGSEDTSKAAEVKVTTTAFDRTGFSFDGTGGAQGAYNADGTLKADAVVVYITEDNKDSVTCDVVMSSKGEATTCTGLKGILDGIKKGYENRPFCLRFVGTVTTPSENDKGDINIDGNKKNPAGITIEGIGEDALIKGFGLRIKNFSDLEIRNLGFMLVASDEGDNITLQQDNDHVWVHNCDFFYGEAGSDSDQAKGDGALDCKKSTYVTFSYNHFWDSGKCNLLGLSEDTTEGLYITYHHNWYDHSDSRHPRVRFYSAHVYNNYYDGNAKYGIGSTMGSSVFAENNYFRNCKYPMLTSMQGSDIATGAGTFSKEDGGTIKAYGNYMEGQKAFVSYLDDKTEFDAYVASSKDEKVPSSVTSKQGSNTYNNFDTDSSVMYSYTADKAEDVPAKVKANAGRLNGGDFQFTFTAADDEDYAVNQALMSALRSYKPSVIAIGSGFTDSTDAPAVTEPSTTPTTPTDPDVPSTEPGTTPSQPSVDYVDVIYASPNGSGSGKTEADPTDVLTAISNVPAGGIIYLLGGTYDFSETILIDKSNSGESGKYKTIASYKGADVVFDFSGQAVNNDNRGVVLYGDYWHFYGFEITKAGDNGMLLSGNNNIIEMMEFTYNQDTGLQISRYSSSQETIAAWPSNNLIKNCTASNNCDDATMENADGFAAKLTCGEGNVFDGCMSYNNSDDGWDLFAKKETGPIGVVTLKNCIAFRNGFTEDGRGYGDCDGNGFKLGGDGTGTRHIVENCLAFENLNCGFTDNNNPEFGEMKDCTAYNNNLGGGDKANFKIYRNSPTATFENLMSYTSTANVSKTNAAGIKAANDKLVGTLTNGIYYNGKYYYAQTATVMENGSKLGDVVTPADSDFTALKVDAMGADFHKTWRNADGSPNPGGFAETPSNGTYASLGYHMSGGVVQAESPVIGVPSTDSNQPTTDPGEQPTETTPDETTEPTTPPVTSGEWIHNFTENDLNSTFYTISGNLSKDKGTVEYKGLTLTQCLKLESATEITFTAPTDGKLTLVFAEEAGTIKVDGTKYTAEGGILIVDVAGGAHTLTKADTANLFYMAYLPVTTPDSDVPDTDAPDGVIYGDADDNGKLELLDVVALNKYLLIGTELTEQGKINANVDLNDKLDATDSLGILKAIVKLVDLPL